MLILGKKMIQEKNVLYERHEAIARITLNRPKKLNALSPQLIVELNEAMKEAERDATVRLVIVTGAGRAFSAGVDLKLMQEGIKDGLFTADQILHVGLELIERIQKMPKIAIAMVNGHCYTGAMELMMAFDLIYAAEEARIGDTHAKWGILPKWGMSQRLPQLVGILKARELSYTCRTITGKEAEKIGLVNRAVPVANLDKVVHETATAIINNSGQTVAAFKHLHRQWQEHGLDRGLQIEQQYNVPINDREEFLRNFEKNK
jgi:enoyl-CoA hydratase/carnithine racemase